MMGQTKSISKSSLNDKKIKEHDVPRAAKRGTLPRARSHWEVFQAHQTGGRPSGPLTKHWKDYVWLAREQLGIPPAELDKVLIK